MAVLFAVGCSSAVKEAPDNLVQDPSLEESSPGSKLPDEWRNLSTPESGIQCAVIKGGRTGDNCLEILGKGEAGRLQLYGKRPESGQRYRGRCWVQFKGDPKAALLLRLEYMKNSGEVVTESEVLIKASGAGDGWQQVAVRDRVPDSVASTQVVLSVIFKGKGTVEIDDFELVADPSLTILRNLLPNGEFENVSGTTPVGWRISFDGGEATCEATEERPFEGWHCLHVKGKVHWTVIGSDRIEISRNKSYVLSGFIRVQSGVAQLKIDYFKGEKYLGSTESSNSYGNEWRNEVVVWQPERFPDADRICGSAVGFDDINACFDKLVLQDQ
jgi:hypothetical protein